MKYKLTDLTWDHKEFNALKKCIEKNSFTMGKEVKSFEKNFAKKFNSKYAIMVNSGSSANLIAVYSLFFLKKNNLNKGDEILVPAISWSTTFNPLINFGLKLKFVDIDPVTLNINENLIEKSISSKTKAIFCVNLLGLSSNLSKIKNIANKYNLHLLEDNCESLASKHKNKFAGTFGKLGTFSFFFSHHIQTMEGGMILTNDEYLYQVCQSLRAHGWSREIKNSKFFSLPNDQFKNKFNFILPGFNLRPLEMSGALGNVQLKKISYFQKIRYLNAKYLYNLMNNDDDFYLQKFDKNSSFFSFAFIKKKNSPINLKKLILFLINKKIEVRPIAAGLFTNQPVIKYANYTSGNLKNAEYISNNSFYVGNYPKNLFKEIDYLINTISKYRLLNKK